MDGNAFVELLLQLTSPNNALRRQAEEVFEQMKQDQPQLCGCLLQVRALWLAALRSACV